jgi:putative peptidoglycan lipid II flippase
MLGIASKWGVAGLTASAGLAAWVEFTLLRASLNRRLGWTGLQRPYLARLWIMALTASAVAVAIKFSIHAGPRLTALAVIPAYAAVYLGMAYWMRIPELDRIVSYARGRLTPR